MTSESRLTAVAYIRVSTDGQHTGNQLPVLEEMARARGLTLVRVYSEHAGAARDRPVYRELLEDAHTGKFGIVLVAALDRLGRSMAGNCAAILALDRANVRVVSAREAWLDNAGPARGLLIAVFSWIAEVEREILSDRTKKGLARVKKAGTRLGRPKRHVDERALLRLKSGESVRKVAQRYKIPRTTLARQAAKALAASPAAQPPALIAHEV